MQGMSHWLPDYTYQHNTATDITDSPTYQHNNTATDINHNTSY